MKIKSLFLTALVLALTSTGFAQSKTIAFAPQTSFEPIIFAESTGSTFDPKAKFESATVEHQVKYNNTLWMRIHIKFRIINALDTACNLTAYFYDDFDGKPLKGTSANYSQNGYVSSGKDFTPNLNDALYNDFQIYIPYEALNLKPKRGDKYNLKFFLNLRNTSDKTDIAKSTWYKFVVQY